MNVSEVTEKLEGFSVEKLKRIRDYERRNKNRETVLERIEQGINALSLPSAVWTCIATTEPSVGQRVEG